MPSTDGRDVAQVAHDVDEAEDGADDSDRRRVASHRLEDLRGVLAVLFLLADRDLERLAERLRVDAVDRHHERLAKERIGGVLGDLLEREDAVAARAVRVVDDLVDDLRRVHRRLLERPARGLERRGERREGILHDDGADRAAENDDRGRPTEHRARVPAFEVVADEDREEREGDADQGAGLHHSPPSSSFVPMRRAPKPSSASSMNLRNGDGRMAGRPIGARRRASVVRRWRRLDADDRRAADARSRRDVAVDDLVERLADDDLAITEEAEGRIGRRFDPRDVVRVDRHHSVIESCELQHRTRSRRNVRASHVHDAGTSHG